MAQQIESVYVDIGQSLHAIPIYNGDSDRLYPFLNAAKQFIQTHGNNPRIIEQVLSRLKDKAADVTCMVEHSYDWETIKNNLINRCGNGKTIDLYKHEVLNMNLDGGSYNDMILRLDKKIFAMESMLINQYNRDHARTVIEIYKQDAKTALIRQLPFNLQTQCISFNYNELCTYVQQLCAHNLLTERKISNKPNKVHYQHPPQNFVPHNNNKSNNYQQRQYPVHMHPTSAPNQNQRHTYPPRPQSLMRQQWQRNESHQRFNNNNFNSRPAQNNNYQNNNYQPQNDVSMRTVNRSSNTARGPPIQLGRGLVAEELFNQENFPENENQNFPNRNREIDTT